MRSTILTVIAIALTLLGCGTARDESTGAKAGRIRPGKAGPIRPGKAGRIRPGDAVGFDGRWYRVYLEDISWHEAKERCEELGGHLATITSAAEQEFIADLADGTYLFLGATDEVEEGTFLWITGEEFSYTCWFEGQPNNYDDEDYLATYDSGDWVDVHAEGDDSWMPIGFICEWDE